MTYSFDIDVATEYGIDCAVFIHNLQFWISKNVANGENFFDGRHWTYNSKRAYAELFPFWSERQVKTIIEKLLAIGIIVKGNYNSNPYDRTNWYAFREESKWVGQKSLLQQTKQSAPLDESVQCTSDENVQPIPDSKPDSKLTDIKPDIKETKLSITHTEGIRNPEFMKEIVVPPYGDVLAGRRKGTNEWARPTKKTVPEDYGLVKFDLSDIQVGDYERLLNWFEYNHRERATGKVLKPYCEKIFNQNVDLIKTLSNECWYYAVDCIEGAINLGYQGFGKSDGFFYKSISLEDYEDDLKIIRGYRMYPAELPERFSRYKPMVYDMAEKFYTEWIENHPDEDNTESEKRLAEIKLAKKGWTKA